MADDPNWPRASAWLKGAHADEAKCCLALLGAPLRLASISQGRYDQAPASIRAALERFSVYDLEFERDLSNVVATDLGDLELADSTPEQALEPLSEAVRRALREAHALVLLGGDNSVTRAACHGVAASPAQCGLITLDAHLDLRHLDAGLTNGNPVRALLADGMPGSQIFQIGIAPFANSHAYFDVARDAGIKVIPAAQVHARGIEEVIDDALDAVSQEVEAIYVDVDIDVLDRAFAPANPGSRRGGLTPADLRTAARLCGAHPKVKVMDLVEIDPTKDVADVTVLAAGLCLLSFTSGLLGRFGR